MIRYLSGEFVLKRMPNGGTAVLLRSLIISVVLYTAVVVFKARITPGASWAFDWAAGRAILADTVPWFGAIFAGVYVALYSRFASQWNYLASLYNQIMATAVQHPPDGVTATQALHLWQAGFIEDAEDLHLATKPMFASVIRSMLKRKTIRDDFIEHAPGGAARLSALEQQVMCALKRSVKHRGLDSEQGLTASAGAPPAAPSASAVLPAPLAAEERSPNDTGGG